MTFRSEKTSDTEAIVGPADTNCVLGWLIVYVAPLAVMLPDQTISCGQHPSFIEMANSTVTGVGVRRSARFVSSWETQPCQRENKYKPFRLS